MDSKEIVDNCNLVETEVPINERLILKWLGKYPAISEAAFCRESNIPVGMFNIMRIRGNKLTKRNVINMKFVLIKYGYTKWVKGEDLSDECYIIKY